MDTIIYLVQFIAVTVGLSFIFGAVLYWVIFPIFDLFETIAADGFIYTVINPAMLVIKALVNKLK